MFTVVLTLALAFITGLTAGLRAMLPLSALSWAAVFGLIHVDGTWLAPLGYTYTPCILTLLALLELVVDKLPTTPSRKVPHQFATRIISGAFGGAAIGFTFGLPVTCLLIGAIGAVAGTYGGAYTRTFLARKLNRNLPAALIEDLATLLLLGLVILILS